ncbi:beta-lactamase domain-containing protein 2-like isoform X1 [Haliotis rubra]|uniref:beta-lactamase domain-containing protein 2-like isoform X1 n=1 Tax=Haliotis rubra TaxID=36100 RepID=UPI001EE561B6|nr:beta-lactamase domain-containing protein 2-like isoform X1 [Haliotis rubra]
MGLVRWGVTLLLFTLAFTYLPRLFAPKLKPHVDGYFHPKFRKVADILRKNVESGKERGAAFAVYHRGEVVVDMWAGYADDEAERPWASDSMCIVFSTTKGMAALAVARMVDKGWLDYKKPVAHYWPGFAQNGKGEITVEQLLGHQGGLVSLGGNKTTLREYRDNQEAFTRRLEEVTPLWEPGTAHGYHAFTFGFYVDTLVRMADPKHRNMTQIFREEIAEPFGIDFHIGLPKSLSHRVARGHYLSPLESIISSMKSWHLFHLFASSTFFPDTITGKSLNVIGLEFNTFNDPEEMSIGQSAVLGIGTARSLAKLYSYMAMGGSIKGKQLLKPETWKLVTTSLRKGQDLVFPSLTSEWGRGVGFRDLPHPKYKGQKIIGHSGFGGQVGYFDTVNQVSLGYITNHASVHGLF